MTLLNRPCRRAHAPRQIRQLGDVGGDPPCLVAPSRREFSNTFAIEPKKLFDETLWIRESNQMTARNYVYVGLEACMGNVPLKFQREKPIVRRTDDKYWYLGPAAKVAGLSENDFRFVALVRRT